MDDFSSVMNKSIVLDNLTLNQADLQLPPNVAVLDSTNTILYTLFLPIFIVFGTIGNILIFIVMRRGSLKDASTCLYMAVLAIADTGEFLKASYYGIACYGIYILLKNCPCQYLHRFIEQGTENPSKNINVK